MKKDLKFVVKVPPALAPCTIVNFLDGDQPCFDMTNVENAITCLGLKEQGFLTRCPATGEKLPEGDYDTLAGYDNRLMVRFRTAENAEKFGKLLGIQ